MSLLIGLSNAFSIVGQVNDLDVGKDPHMISYQ